MKVKFYVIDTTLSWAGSNHHFRYECSEPKNNSGDYYPAAEYEALESELARLHKKVKYQYLYTSFLLDQTSEETFKALAPEYDEYLNIEREIEVAKAALQAKLAALESELAIAKAGIEAMTVRIK